MRMAVGLLAFLTLVCVGYSIARPAPSTAQGYHVEYLFKGHGDAGDIVAGLIEFENKLYGTSLVGGVDAHACPEGCGTVFSFDPASGAETVVHAFHGPRDGSEPRAGLLSFGGALYGTTPYGGKDGGQGAVFQVKPATDAEKLLYSFQGGSDGAAPDASLIPSGGLFYGTTDGGGGASACANGCGAVYSIEPKSGVETVVYAFQGTADGAHPMARLLQVGGLLYGTTANGGGSPQCEMGCGTVFSVDPTTGREAVLHAFQGGGDGIGPNGGLVAVGGLLYGTTIEGGPGSCGDGCGTVYSVDPTTGAERVVYAFPKPGHGYEPVGELIKVGGRLYGVTELGGGAPKGTCDGGCGTLFSLDVGTGAQRILHSFTAGNDGEFPAAGLTYVGGRLYGTTAASIFSFLP